MKTKIFRNLLIGMAVMSGMCGCSATQCIGMRKNILTGYALNELPRVETHYLQTQEDFDGFNEILENRNGNIIIEISDGIVLDGNGNGRDDGGYYIHYDASRFGAGESVRTMCIYDPNTAYIDDIVYRADFLID